MLTRSPPFRERELLGKILRRQILPSSSGDCLSENHWSYMGPQATGCDFSAWSHSCPGDWLSLHCLVPHLYSGNWLSLYYQVFHFSSCDCLQLNVLPGPTFIPRWLLTITLFDHNLVLRWHLIVTLTLWRRNYFFNFSTPCI